MIDFLTQWHGNFLDPDRAPFAIGAILLATVIGMITGPLAGNAYPFFWWLLGKLFGGVGDKLDKPKRPKADLAFRGLVLSVFVIVIAALIGKALDALTSTHQYGLFIEIISLSLLISCGAVWFALLRLYFAMEQKKMDGAAYFAIARSTRTNLSQVDDFAITRTGLNFTARSFDKAIVAPVLWYLIAGFTGACVYAALAALSWRFNKDGTSKGFGAVPAALEKLMGFFPAILSGLIITLASTFTPTAKLHKGLTAWLGHKNRASYEQGGFALSAMAWCLNVSLGGASQDISGHAIKSEWVGPEGATAQNDHKHLRRAIFISVMAHILFIGVLAGLYLWSGIMDGHMLKFLTNL